jgi:transposase
VSNLLTTYIKPKRKSKLSCQQQTTIQLIVTNSLPTDHGYETLLWTRKLVADLCLKKFGIQISESSIGKCLRSLNLSHQKPIRKAYQQDPIKVASFCEEFFPGLIQKAERENAEICWFDEASVRSDPCNGKTWGLLGQTPIIPQNGHPERTNVIGTLSLTGASHFLVYQCKTDSDLVTTYLDAFMKTKEGKVYIILDNAERASYHFIEETAEKLGFEIVEKKNVLNFRIGLYDVHGNSAVTNYETLISYQNKLFFWDDKRFKKLQIGDVVFWVNRPKKEILATKKETDEFFNKNKTSEVIPKKEEKPKGKK